MNITWKMVGYFVVAGMIYISLGFVLAQATRETCPKTAVTEIAYNALDFMGAVGKYSGSCDEDKWVTIALWPGLALMFFVKNLLVLIWHVVVWVFAGGLLKWVGMIG